MKRTAIVSTIRNQLGNRLVFNAFILMAMRMFASASGFVFWAVTARMLVPHDVGLASGSIAAAILLAGLGQLGFGYGLVRHLPGSSDPARLINSVLVTTSVAALALGVVFLAGISFWSPALAPLHAGPEPIAAFLLLTVTTAVTQALGWAFLARRTPVYTLYKNTLQSALGIVFLFVFAMQRADYMSVVHAYMASTVLSLLVAMFFFVPRSEPGYRFRVALPTRQLGSFASYSLVNYAADQFSRWGQTLIPLMVVNVLGPATAAFFSIVWSIGSGLSSLDEAVSSSLFAEGANDPKKLSHNMWHALKLALGVATAVAVAAVVTARFILMIYGRDYVANGTLPLIIVAVGLIPYAVVPIYSTFLRVRDHLKMLVVANAIDIGTALLFSYFFMAPIGLNLGLVGAALGWFVSRFVLLAVIVPLWKQQMGHLPSGKEVQNEGALG